VYSVDDSWPGGTGLCAVVCRSGTDEDRHFGMMYHVVTDATKERTSYSVKTSCTHNDQLGVLKLSTVDDALASVLHRRLTAHLVTDLRPTHTQIHYTTDSEAPLHQSAMVDNTLENSYTNLHSVSSCRPDTADSWRTSMKVWTSTGHAGQCEVQTSTMAGTATAELTAHRDRLCTLLTTRAALVHSLQVQYCTRSSV